MITAWQKGDKIVGSYRDTARNLSTKKLGTALSTAFAKECDMPKIRVQAESCSDFSGWRKFIFKDYDSRKLALQSHEGLLWEGDISPTRRLLSDHKVVLEKPFRCFFDIETNPEVPFSEKERTRLLCAVVRGEDGRKKSFVLEDDCDESEAELWEAVTGELARYDQVLAWNGEGFDFPVMEARIERLRNYRQFEAYWENKRRLLLVDQMAAYKRFNTASESGDEKTSMALQSVAMSLLGEGKNDFSAKNCMKAWRAGGHLRQEMVDYCGQDVDLLPKIEEKTGFLDIFQTLCSLTTALPNNHGLKPVAQFDAMLLRKANLAKTHLPSRVDDRVATPYVGAYVMKSKVHGIMRMVHVVDFASLYPSVLRTFNMGWDTKVTEGGCLVPSTGVRFSTESESMLSGVIRECMELRVFWKKKKESLTPGTDEWKSADRTSTAYKTFTNSGYGVVGSLYSRYYDREIVESITLGGQWLIKETIAAAESRGWVCVYSDTDSCFVVGCSVEEFDEFTRWCNSDLYPRLLAGQQCEPKYACVKLSYEKCFDRLIVPQGNTGTPAGKRYAGSFKHYGGVAGLAICPPGVQFDKTKHSKPEVKGLEYKRSDSLKYTRLMQEECIMKILAGEEDPSVLEAWVLSKREEFFTKPIDATLIVKSMGISKSLDAYKTSGPHVRIAREMEHRGEDVSEGTRIGFITVDGSVSPTSVIPVEEFDGTNCDRWYYWNKQIYPAIMRVLAGAYETVNWSRWLGKRPKAVLKGQQSLF